MSLFFVLLLILLFIGVLLFTAVLRVKFVFDSNKEKANLTFSWLNPFLKALVTMENAKPVLTIFLFNKKVYRGRIKSRKQNKNSMDMVKLANPKDVHVNAYYGFRDPFTTGVACGVMNIASRFINIDSMQQVPDFMADSDYIYLDATAKVNVGSTLVNLYKSKND